MTAFGDILAVRAQPRKPTLVFQDLAIPKRRFRLLPSLAVPRVDLTSRIREADAIRETPDRKLVIAIHDAEIPAGKHLIQVSAKDSRGKDSAVYLTVEVGNRQSQRTWSWTSESPRRVMLQSGGGCGSV